MKVDAGAVFVPERLVNCTHLLLAPLGIAFLVNCEKAKYGFFNGVLLAFGKFVQTKQSLVE